MSVQCLLPGCGLPYTARRHLRAHLNRKHRDVLGGPAYADDNFLVNTTGLPLSEVPQLRKDLAKPLPRCSFCGTRFTVDDSLRRHLVKCPQARTASARASPSPAGGSLAPSRAASAPSTIPPLAPASSFGTLSPPLSNSLAGHVPNASSFSFNPNAMPGYFVTDATVSDVPSAPYSFDPSMTNDWAESSMTVYPPDTYVIPDLFDPYDASGQQYEQFIHLQPPLNQASAGVVPGYYAPDHASATPETSADSWY